MKINQFLNSSGSVRLALLFSAFILLAGLLSGCDSKTNSDSRLIEMAPLSVLPSEIRKAPITVRESYQFAVANPDSLKNVPCYCGCGTMGHTSNYDCYIDETRSSGEILFDEHALGCSICVDISQDVIKMTRDAQQATEIRAYIDATYSQYGPSNMLPVE